MDFINRIIVAVLVQAARDRDTRWCSTTGRDWCTIMGWDTDPAKLRRKFAEDKRRTGEAHADQE